ncbi:MAG: hypothetical protein K2H43_00610, partial [Clostridia bacterium]|nr:hypothetical protein [Clostridia bacterium]
MKRLQSKRNLLFSILIMILSLPISLTALFGIFNEEKSEAYTSGQIPASIGSLTLSDYATRTDGYVFDGDVVDSLFTRALNNANVSINSSQSLYDQLYNKVSSSSARVQAKSTAGVTDTTIDANAWSTQVKSMDFSTVSGGTTDGNGNKTAPKPITVEFGGYMWNVVYMTTNTTVGNNDLIATLW